MKVSKTVNQAQGPRSGNAGTASKRDEFIAMRSNDSSRQAAADLVMSRLESRNPAPFIDNKVEPLVPNSGPKRNPTAGGTLYNKSKPRPAPRPGKSAARIAK